MLLPFVGFAAGGEDCANATTIATLPYTDSGSTANAINNYTGSCGGTGGAPDHVYSIIPAQNGTIDISLCSGLTNYDTKLFVIKDDCTNGTEVACNDDACSNDTIFTQPWISELTAVPVVANTTYYIVIGGWSATNSGDYTINVTGNFVTGGPCADTTITAPVTNLLETTTGAGDDCTLRTSEDYILEVNLPTPGDWTFSLCNSSYDTWLTVGSTCCSDDLGSNDDNCGLQSEVSIVGMAAGTYFVHVEGFSGAGDFTLNISTAGIGTPPGTDCVNPLVITGLPFNETAATTNGFGDDYSTTPCNTNYIGGDEKIYTYTPAQSETVIITVNNISDAWAGIQVTPECPDVATACFAETNNTTATTDLVLDSVALTGGTTYYLAISTWPTPQTIASYDLNIAVLPTTGGGPCPLYGTTFGSATAPTNGGTDTVSTCNWAGEDMPILSVVAGETYELNSSIGTDHVFVYDPSGALVPNAFGQVPLQFVAPVSGDYMVALALNDTCGTETVCRLTTITHHPSGSPAGTNCANPLVVTSLPYNDNDATTAGFGDDYSSTPCNAVYIGGDDKVYTYTPANNEMVNVTVSNISDAWAGIQVTDACPDAATTCVGEATNSNATTDLEIDSLQLVGGQTYYIVASSWPAPQSIDSFDLSITLIPTTGGCTADFNVNAPYNSGTVTTLGAGDDCSLRTTEDHIYSVFLPQSGDWTFSLCGSAYDTWLTVGTTCCSDDLGSNDDDCGLQSEIVLTGLSAGLYWVQVEGFSGAGDYTLDISLDTIIVGNPPGTDCVDPLVVTALPYTDANASTAGFGDDYSATACNASYIGGDEKVYTYTPAANETVNITMSQISDSWAGIQVLADCPDVATTCLAEANNTTATTDLVVDSLQLTGGTTYYILASTWPAPQTVDYQLDITLIPTGPTCAADFAVTAPYNSGTVSTLGAGDDCALRTTEDHIYSVVIPSTGNWTFQTCGSSYDTWLTVGTTCCSDDLGSNDDSCGLQSGITLANLAAGTYFVQVEGFSGAGDYVLDISSPVVGVPNDFCANAITLAVGANGSCPGAAILSSTALATASPMSQTSCDAFGTNVDVFFTFTAPAAGAVQINAINTTATIPPEMAIYDSCGGTELFCFAQGQTQIATGLTAGSTYILQVWHDQQSGPGDFEICLQIPPTPPVNDDCTGAVALTVGAAGSCPAAGTAGSTVAAAASAMASTSCDSFGINLDLFYSFVAPASGSVEVDIDNVTATATPEFAIYSSCGGADIQCFSPGATGIAAGLTPGNTYILQMWHDDGGQGDFTICLSTAPPAPLNDDCAGAMPLIVNLTGACATATVSATTTAASASSMSQTSCDGFGTNLDVFFSFVAPAGGSVEINLANVTATTVPEAAVYDSCGGTEIACISPATGSNVVSGLTAGQTYILQVWHDAQLGPGDFEVCLQVPAPPPANDDCANAMVVNVGTTGDCPGNSVTATTTNATASATALTSCDGFGTNLDVFFSFIAPAAGEVDITLANITATFNPEAVVYDACGGTEVVCLSPAVGTNTVTGLTGGNTYILQVWHDDGGEGDFTLCIEGPASLTNDECSGAIQIPHLSACVPYTADAAGATESMPGCTGDAGDDVWFSFVAVTGQVHIEVVGSASYDAVIEAFDSCGGTSLGCEDSDFNGGGTEILTLFNLTPGNTYMVRVYDWFAAAPATTTFTICVYNAAQPAANDECSTAITLPQLAACAPYNAESAGATESMTGCTGTADDDVWFNFVAVTGQVNIEVTGSASYDAVIELFDACGGTSLGCVDDDFTGGGTEILTATGLNVGSTYSFRVYDWFGAAPATTTFDVCVYNAPQPLPGPINDSCSNAHPLVVKTFCDPITATTLNATESQAGCTGTADDDVWFSFTATSTQNLIEVTGSAGFDAVIELFDACGGTSMGCVDDDFTGGGTEIMNATGLTMGNDYLVRVYHWFGTPATTPTFSICVYDTTACPAPADNWTTKIGADRARLNWTPVAEALRYQIRGKKLTNTTWKIIDIDYTTPTLRDVWGLDTNDTYIWQVRAICDSASNLYSQFTPFDTFQTVCNMPDSNWIDPITPTAMRLNWTPVTGAYGYGMRMREVGGPFQLFTFSPNVTSKVLYGLTPGQAYRWRMWTYCDSLGTYESEFTPLIEVTLPTINRFASESALINDEALEIFLAPNPARDMVSIHLSQPVDGFVEIVDLAGKTLLGQVVENEAGDEIKLNTSTISGGVYQVVFTEQDGNTIVKRLMLSK